MPKLLRPTRLSSEAEVTSILRVDTLAVLSDVAGVDPFAVVRRLVAEVGQENLL